MTELLKINVNEHTEKKGLLTYLSWAWAWAEVLKHDPAATWVAHQYGPQGSEQPCIVHTSVTIKGRRRECLLPVMDHKNNAVKSPDARKISDAIMRCMTKAIAMHGLGLYIYAGEDLPEADDRPELKPAPSKGVGVIKSTDGCWEMVPVDQHQYLRDLAEQIKALAAPAACDLLEFEQLENEQKVCVWSLLPSNIRSGIKKEAEARTLKAAA